MIEFTISFVGVTLVFLFVGKAELKATWLRGPLEKDSAKQ